jgi:hypothetical protein
VNAVQGIAADATVGDEVATGFAAPAGGILGAPSPAPSGQEGAAPDDGQVGAAPRSEEPSQQDAPAPDPGVPASSGVGGRAEPVTRHRPAPAPPGTTPVSTPSEPPLVADRPPRRIYEPGPTPRHAADDGGGGARLE